jgi:hypothetical protein
MTSIEAPTIPVEINKDKVVITEEAVPIDDHHELTEEMLYPDRAILTSKR